MAITEQEEFEFRRRAELEQAMPKKEAVPLARQVADVPLKVGAGVVGGVRMVTDAFGANNPVSQNLKGMEGYISDLFSAQSKKDSAEISRIMKDAEDKGVGDQLKAAVNAFSTAPIDFLSNALGTAAPAIAAGMAGAVLRLGALGVGALQAGTGAAMGAGIVKGSIYDAVKEELKKTDMSPEQVEARAQKAQEYGGQNLDSILAGAALTGLASTVGIDPIIARGLSKKIIGEAAGKEAAKQAPKGVARRTAEVAALEAIPEGLQGAQEKLAENIALQREGIETPTMRGVVGAGALEALAGAGTGAAVGALSPQRTAPEATPVIEPAPVEAPTPEATDEVTPPEVIPTTEITPPEVGEAPSIGEYHIGEIEPLAPMLNQIQTKAEQQDVVAQMESVAANPDYSLLGKSDNTETGAPVIISDFKIPKELMGNVEDIKDESGKDIKAQYAVLEAGEILTANTLEGAPNADYTNTEEKGTRVIYGNNRITGLKAAYDNGTATDYTPALLDDPAHGIDPAVIAGMDRPVLVRVIPKSTLDIATSKWDAPEDSQLDRIIEKLQNKLLPLKRAQESIKKSGAEILDKNNPYQQEELYHNRASKRVDDFVSKELNPLLEEMKKRGVTLDQVEEYLQARHAEEANRVIAERNPDDTELQDGGSGMNTADAKKYLDGLSKSERDRLSAVAEKLDAILESTRNIYVSEKLVSKAQMSSWKNMFKHYIPLMREDKDGAMGVGQGYSIRGKEVRNRTGSKAKVIDVIANIAIQREKAIVRSEKNRVGKALVGLVKLNPNPEFWTINKVPTERVLNEKTGLVEERSDPLYRKRDNVITVKIEDSKGEIKEHAVVFNEKNPVAVRLASALKNLDATQLEGVMAASASITRYFSAINTQYNPIFGVVNLIRDSQASLINLSSTPLAGHQKEVLSKIVPSLVGIYSAVRNARKGKESANSYGKLFDELQLEGGMTGYRDLYKDSSDRSKAIKYALDPHAWQKSKLGNIFTAGGRLKVPLAVAQDKAKVIFDWLSDYNLSMEGAARLAVYKTALDNGMSKPQAASLAKNISVNFNRKGLAGQQAGALFAFFNASMQGTARIGETLFTMNNGNIKTLRLNGLGKKIVGGGILLGSMQAIALSLAGFDDDEPPEFIRERNFILPIGGKKYLTLPMPLGFHAIPNIGRITTEFSLGGFKKPGDHVLKLLGVFADAFNPIGNSGLSVQTIAPTPIDPLVGLGENRDWTGQPISREDYNKLSPTPGFTRSKDVSSDTSRLLAEAINYLSGGTKYTPGKLSPTADQIDYLAGQVTGGVGREAAKISQTAKAVSTGEELPPHKIPLVGRFYGDTDTQSSQGAKFYANLKKLNEVEAELKGRIKDRIPATEYRTAHPELRLVPLANRVESNVSELRTLKRKLIEKDAPKEKIKNIETRITVLMKRLNDRVKEHESREK